MKRQAYLSVIMMSCFLFFVMNLSPCLFAAEPDSPKLKGCPIQSASACNTNDASPKKLADWILFHSVKIGMIRPDGTGRRYLDFPEKKQLRFQTPGLMLDDGNRLVIWSQEPPLDPKASFYDKKGAKYARSHLWDYDFADDQLNEIDLPTLMGIAGICPDGRRMVVCGEEDPDNPNTRVYNVLLNGTDKKQFHELSGFAYCFKLSPDGKQVAYHQASEGYKLYVMDMETGTKTLIDDDSDYLNFGPEWSPDGQWLVYQRCLHKDDPMHQRSDICIARPDASEKRLLTHGQRQWFGTSYGTPDNAGWGSNFPHWSPDGKWITFTRCSDGAQSAWIFNKNRTDTDHFNCDYFPDKARGGSQICLVDIDGNVRDVTPFEDRVWVWRTAWSADSKHIVYIRAAVGQLSELWIIDSDGKNPRMLTGGWEGKNIDFPYWVQLNY